MSIEEKLQIRTPRKNVRWEWIAGGICLGLMMLMLMVRMYFIYYAPPTTNVPKIPQVEATYEKPEVDKLDYYRELQEKKSQAEMSKAHQRQKAQNYFEAFRENNSETIENADSDIDEKQQIPIKSVNSQTSNSHTNISKSKKNAKEQTPQKDSSTPPPSVQFHTTVIPTQTDTNTNTPIPMKQSSLLKAEVIGTQNVVVGEMVQLQLSHTLHINNVILPSSTLFYATLSQYGNRVMLHVNQIKHENRFIQVEMEAIDEQGNRGLLYDSQSVGDALQEEGRKVGEELISDVLDQVVPNGGGLARRLLRKDPRNQKIEFPDGMNITFKLLNP